MGTGPAKPPLPGTGDDGPDSPGTFGLAEPSVSEQDRPPAASGRDRGEKAPTADSGAPGSLFTPRVPAQPRPAEADRERAKEAAPAGAEDPGPADTSKPDVSREAKDLLPAGRIREQDGAREAEDPDQAKDADAAEDTRPADRAAEPTGGDGGDAAGNLGSGDRAEMAADAGDAADASDAADLGDAGDLDAEAKDAPGDAGESADDKPDTAAASAGEAALDRSAGEATPDRKPAPAGDRDQKPGEKPDKPGTDEKGGSGATPLDGEVTIVPGVSRYHRRGCILIRFLSDGDLETMTRGEAETAGSIPCKACQPDKPLSES
jgi:hypothetical protein